MPGCVIICSACGKQIRIGYSTLAIDYAAKFRFGHGYDADLKKQLVEEFYEHNPTIMREEPEVCPECGAAKSNLKKVHVYQ